MSVPVPSRWSRPILLASLMTAFFLQSHLASRIKTPTYDEPAHLAAGLHYLETGEFHLNAQHPPLLKELSGTSLLLAGIHWPRDAAGRPVALFGQHLEWDVGNEILRQHGWARVLLWARLPLLLLTTAMAVPLFLWGRRLAGERAALGALVLFACSPTLIAHASSVTTDTGFAALTVAFCAALWAYLERRSPLRLLVAGLALGAALAAKFSGVILVPVAAALLLVAAGGAPAHPADRFDPLAAAGPWRRALWLGAALLGMSLVAAVVVQAAYFFTPDPLVYLHGLQQVNADHDPGYETIVAGRPTLRPVSYYLVTYLLKEPLPAIVLAALGVLVLLRRGPFGALARAFLLLPPVVLLVAYSLASYNLGIRYLAPVLPFTYLLGGIGADALCRRGRWGAAVAGGLGLWLVVGAGGIYPDHLSYFNESACLLAEPRLVGLDGGTRCGPRWLDDSNVDWGQGLEQLRTWVDTHARGRPVRLVYFGTVAPEAFPVDWERLTPDAILVRPTSGLYAVSAHWVARVPALSRAHLGGDLGAWLRTTAPRAIVGHAIYVYDFDATGPGG